jgi:hypothetical protein
VGYVPRPVTAAGADSNTPSIDYAFTVPVNFHLEAQYKRLTMAYNKIEQL